MTGDRRILHISFGATHPAIIYFVNNLWNMRDTGPRTDVLYRPNIDQSLSCLRIVHKINNNRSRGTKTDVQNSAVASHQPKSPKRCGGILEYV